MFENVRHCEKSDVGLERHNNEDSYLIVDQCCNQYDLRDLGQVFVIADGMGGHAAGEIASKMACEEVVAAYYRDDATLQDNGGDSESKLRRLEQAIWSAHNKIIDFARNNEGLRGMGTTLSALVLADSHAIIGHVGDSRVYRYRNNSCNRLTVDHTKNQALIDIGQIHPDHEHNHCYGNILTQAIGGYGDLGTVFTRVEDVRSGDTFLLCTDGLHDLVSDKEINGMLMENPLPQSACEKLVQAAIRNGGRDNVTVVVIQI